MSCLTKPEVEARERRSWRVRFCDADRPTYLASNMQEKGSHVASASRNRINIPHNEWTLLDFVQMQSGPFVEQPLKSCPILCCSLNPFSTWTDTGTAEWSMLHLWALLSLDQCRCMGIPATDLSKGLHIKLIELIELMFFSSWKVDVALVDLPGHGRGSGCAPWSTGSVFRECSRTHKVESTNQQWAPIGHWCSYVLYCFILFYVMEVFAGLP